jgi:hypothetical protein
LEPVRDRAEGLAQARLRDFGERHEPRQRLEHRREPRRPDDRDRAAFDGFGHMRSTVVATTGPREEEISGLHATGVVRETAHHRVDPRWAGDLRAGGDEFGEERRGVRGHG